MLSTPIDKLGCGSFEGSPEFYGLGIRLGVYLQVLSSWITNRLNEEATADTHVANSIFLLAIIVAVVTAVSDEEIRPVEVWIMLQACLMFPLTVLSAFGIRTNFLSLSPIHGLLTRINYLSKSFVVEVSPSDIFPSWMCCCSRKSVITAIPINVKVTFSHHHDLISREIVVHDEIVEQVDLPSPETGPAIGLTLKNFLPGVNISLKVLSLLRHFTLTWAGAIWRILILLFVVGTNLCFWFSFWNHTSCGYSVFLFANVRVNAPLAKFFKAGAILLALVAVVPLLVIVGFLVITIRYAISLLMAQKDSMTPSLTELAKAMVYFSTRSDGPPRKKLQFDTSTTNSSEGFSIKMDVHAGIPGVFTSPSVGPSFEKRSASTNTHNGELISQNTTVTRRNFNFAPFGIGRTYEITK